MNEVFAVRFEGAVSGANQSAAVKNGSFVNVKVLLDNGGGNFLVSFAGSTFNVKSEIPLSSGDAFSARIKIDGKKIVLNPQRELEAQTEQNLKILSDDGNPGPVLSRILQNYGLAADAINVKLLQFLEQGNFLLDKKLILKARSIALNFPGKEKAAAEIAMALFERGIKADVSVVRKFLMLIEDGFAEDSAGKKDDDKKENSKNDESLNERAETSEESENSLLENSNRGGKDLNSAGKNAESQNAEGQDAESRKGKSQKGEKFYSFLEKIYGKIPEASFGKLTFLNQIKENSSKHWILLPYEWNLKKSENKFFLAKGFIRLLLDASLKTVEKVSVECKIEKSQKNWTNYFFVLYLNASKVKEVRFCTLPSLLTSQILHEERRLGELFSSGMNLNTSVTVTYSALAFTEGLFANSEIPFLFNDTV